MTQILAAEPQIFVTDMERSLAFYRDILGFRTVFTFGEPVFYAQVARQGARINLRLVAALPFDPAFRTREVDALSATLALDEAEPLFREYQEAGACFHQPLRTEDWGAKSFILADPDGNLIAFAGS